ICRRLSLEKKYQNSPAALALVHRTDIEIDNFDILTIGSGTSLGRFCSLRDAGSSNTPRSISLGRQCHIGPSVEFAVWDNHHICLKGDTSVNEGTKIYGSVTIEKYCSLSGNIFASSGNHNASYIPPLLIKDQDNLVSDSASTKESDKP